MHRLLFRTVQQSPVCTATRFVFCRPRSTTHSGGGPHLGGLLLARLALLFLCDPGVDLREGSRGLLDDDAACEVQKIESRRRAIVHVFDITA